MQSHTSSNTLTRGKYQRVSQNLESKKWMDYGTGLSIGSFTLHPQVASTLTPLALGLGISPQPNT